MGLNPARGKNLANLVRRRSESGEAVFAQRIGCCRWFAGVFRAVVVRVEIDCACRHASFGGIENAIAIEIVPDGSFDCSASCGGLIRTEILSTHILTSGERDGVRSV